MKSKNMEQLQARVEKDSPIWKEPNRSKIVRAALQMYYFALEFKRREVKKRK